MVYRHLLVLAGLTFFLALFFGNLIPGGGVVESKTVAVIAQQEQPSPGLPVRLTIPAIHVDAVVEYVGLTGDGAVEVPKDPLHVAWFNLSPRPGERGVSVIDGHFGWKNNLPAVFDDLHTLRKGDRLYVEDDKGVITTFVVQKTRNYNQSEDASGVFDSSDGKIHLNLITCEGVWNVVSKNYSERFVVFTDKEE